jgi:hypothetical protein
MIHYRFLAEGFTVMIIIKTGQQDWKNNTWWDNKVRELIAVKVLHISLLETTVVAFQVLPLGSYAPMPAPSPPLITGLELVL